MFELSQELRSNVRLGMKKYAVKHSKEIPILLNYMILSTHDQL